MLDNMENTSPLVWPSDDYTRTPYEVYTSDDIFAQEQQKIFNGQTWVFLGLECELNCPGDYTTSFIGTTPVVVSRAPDNKLYGFVNKCAHRGAKVVRELRGNAKFLKCLYHGWTYDNTGDLKAVPMQKGMMGNGGYPDDFKLEEHCLRKLKIDTIAGVIFGVVALLVISWLYGTIAGLDDSSRFTVMVEVSIQNIVVASLIAVTLLDRPEFALFSAVYAPPMAIIILVLLVFRLRRLSRAETA
jgi:nitrite reductase/ring-hydroxylating ferredoxin subunit